LHWFITEVWRCDIRNQLIFCFTEYIMVILKYSYMLCVIIISITEILLKVALNTNNRNVHLHCFITEVWRFAVTIRKQLIFCFTRYIMVILKYSYMLCVIIISITEILLKVALNTLTHIKCDFSGLHLYIVILIRI